jgi:hypothetical protein
LRTEIRGDLFSLCSVLLFVAGGNPKLSAREVV